jgi:hypothetical protein
LLVLVTPLAVLAVVALLFACGFVIVSLFAAGFQAAFLGTLVVFGAAMTLPFVTWRRSFNRSPEPQQKEARLLRAMALTLLVALGELVAISLLLASVP